MFRLIWWLFSRSLLIAVVAVAGYAAWLDIDVQQRFDGRRWQVPAQVYSRSLELYVGARVGQSEVVAALDAAGYTRRGKPSRPGEFFSSGDKVIVHTRDFRYWDSSEGAQQVRIEFADDRVLRLSRSTQSNRADALAVLRLEPQLIGRILPGHREDRVLVRLDEVPEHFVDALLAVEDRQFFSHYGISLRGIARAVLVNLRAGAAIEGGSTITQQLAKNFFLDAQRTVWRKLNDALIAIILEMRYSKADILEAYLNEIYFGQDRERAIHGIGSAAQFYFGRDVAQLNLVESALLVGMIQAPNALNPRRHPERATKRRAAVLNKMQAQEVLTEEEAERASKAPLAVLAQPPGSNFAAPAFMQLVRRQLRAEYDAKDLRSEGLRIFTTLSPHAQAVAERSARAELTRIEKAKKIPIDTLQTAVVVVDATGGEVRALVGGREPNKPGFNRALDARRPIGSLIKPVVYLRALEQSDRFNLASIVDDVPVSLEQPNGQTWEPSNYDGRAHGQTSLLNGLAKSYNLATVNIGLEVGVEEVLARLRALGVETNQEPFPSVLLGSIELSPIQVAQMFQALANQGYVAPLKAISAVTRADGSPLSRYPLQVRQGAPTGATNLIVRALHEVFLSGTARSARKRVGDIALAGKTGTTDELRDSWFAGFGADLVSVVWVGRDDNKSTKLSGASGALVLWAELAKALQFEALDFSEMSQVEWHWVEPSSGKLATPGCGGSLSLPFLSDGLPEVNSCTARSLDGLRDADAAGNGFWERVMGRRGDPSLPSGGNRQSQGSRVDTDIEDGR